MNCILGGGFLRSGTEKFSCRFKCNHKMEETTNRQIVLFNRGWASSFSESGWQETIHEVCKGYLLLLAGNLISCSVEEMSF